MLPQPEAPSNSSSPEVKNGFSLSHPSTSSEDGSKSPYSLSEEVVYVYLMPTVSAVGIVGNVAVAALLVASTREEATVGGKRRAKRFSGYMYEYMKGIAILDTLYLIFSIQTAYMVSNGITQDVTEPSSSDLDDFDPYSDSVNSLSSRAAAVYWWNVFSPLWNAWSGASDFVLAVMTVERYLVMRRIDQVDTCQKLRKRRSYAGAAGADGYGADGARRQSRLAWIKMCACLVFSLVAHLPYFFQFDVENCGYVTDNVEVPSCYIIVASSFSETVTFKCLSIGYQLVMSFVQWAVILALNVALMLKLRTIWTRQRKLKEAMSNYPRRPAQERRFSLASVGTISHLIFRPPDVSKEAATPAPHLDHAALHKARRGKIGKKGRSGRLSLLPATKLSGREMNLTVLMVAVASFHVLLTAPGNAEYLMWTVFPDVWNDWEGRSTFEAVAGLLLCVNYSVNFFLLCAADSEIKRAADDALDRIRSAFCCCCNS